MFHVEHSEFVPKQEGETFFKQLIGSDLYLPLYHLGRGFQCKRPLLEPSHLTSSHFLLMWFPYAVGPLENRGTILTFLRLLDSGPKEPNHEIEGSVKTDCSCHFRQILDSFLRVRAAQIDVRPYGLSHFLLFRFVCRLAEHERSTREPGLVSTSGRMEGCFPPGRPASGQPEEPSGLRGQGVLPRLAART